MGKKFSADKFRLRLAELGWTRRDAAQRLGIGTSTLGRWLLGAQPRPDAIAEAARALGVEIADLFESDSETRSDLLEQIQALHSEVIVIRNSLRAISAGMIRSDRAIFGAVEAIANRLGHDGRTDWEPLPGNGGPTPLTPATATRVDRNTYRPPPAWLANSASPGYASLLSVPWGIESPEFPGRDYCLAKQGPTLRVPAPHGSLLVIRLDQSAPILSRETVSESVDWAGVPIVGRLNGGPASIRTVEVTPSATLLLDGFGDGESPRLHELASGHHFEILGSVIGYAIPDESALEVI